MIKAPASFPHAGSYGLAIDPEQPEAARRAELVRVHRHHPVAGQLTVTFPLRGGASGTRVIATADLIDGTALTKDEEHRLTDLKRAIAGCARPDRVKVAEAEALRLRLVMSTVLQHEIDKLAHVTAVDQRFARAGGWR